MLVFIDPGHGGEDPGRIGYHQMELHEDHVNWAVGTALATILRNHEHEILFTRKQSETTPVGERASLANSFEREDSLFLSLHCNGHWEASPKGFEVWHYPGSMRGEWLARKVLESMENKIPRPSRGLKPQSEDDHKQAKKLTVLASTKMPAILVEMEFLSNREGQRFLCRGDSQARLAEAISTGVLQWIEEAGS